MMNSTLSFFAGNAAPASDAGSRAARRKTIRLIVTTPCGSRAIFDSAPVQCFIIPRLLRLCKTQLDSTGLNRAVLPPLSRRYDGGQDRGAGPNANACERRFPVISHKACHCCGLIHRLPPLETGQVALCTQCENVVYRPGGARRSAARTAAAAAGALVLF